MKWFSVWGSLMLLVFLFSMTGVHAADDIQNTNTSEKCTPVRVLIVTGVEYPGHPWKEIAPRLRVLLDADERLEVRVVEDPEVLGTDLIDDYQVLVIHFKNYDPLRREETAQRNLVKFVESGGGLMYYHFACGAFQEWKDFEKIAGRVWNPQLRGHDPFGEFQVRVADPEHSIMNDVHDFMITDELYTCLDGTTPIHVIAEAKSVVDEKMYPIAFVLECGEGRIFHSVLGHDLRALDAEEHVKMLRNAATWCGHAERKP